VDDARDREGVEQLGIGCLNDERLEEEVRGLEAGPGDDDRMHRKDLLLFEGRREPNGDQRHGPHNRITHWPYADPLQSICLRMNVGISMSLRSCSGDDRSFSGVTGGLLAGVGRLGISPKVFLLAPFPRGARSGMTGEPLTIGDGLAITLTG